MKRKHLNRRLLNAIVMHNITDVQDLLNAGADINARDNEHQETAVILAVKFADAAMIRLLLESGAEVDAQDDQGYTAVFFASVASDEFKALLEGGANIHARDKEGNTLLMRKVRECVSLAELETLLQLNVDPGLTNDEGETALDIAESLGLVIVANRLRRLAESKR